MAWIFFDAGLDHMFDGPRQWGRSPGSFFARYASGFGSRLVRNSVQLGGEMVLCQDSRYRPSGKSGMWPRVGSALLGSVVARNSAGGLEPSYGRMAAAVVGTGVSSAWYPQTVNAALLVQGLGFSILGQFQNNIITEFEGDARKFGGKLWKRIKRGHAP